MTAWVPTPYPLADLGLQHVSQLGNSTPNDCGAGALLSIVRRYNPASTLTVEQAYRQGVPQPEWGRGMKVGEVQTVMAGQGVATIYRAGLTLLDLVAYLLARRPVLMLINYGILVDAGLTQFSNFRGAYYIVAVGSDLASVIILDPYADEQHGRYPVPVDMLIAAWERAVEQENPKAAAIIPLVGIGDNPGDGYRMKSHVINGLTIRAEPKTASKDLGILLRSQNPVVYITGQPASGYVKLRDRSGWVWFALLEPIT